ncbi:hypothetical protein QAD02_005031 [Eretmocerus hayati]|uniref:Uncharacterized protein n=1 Tax=Eretmocerus hayati TaxID=131215 RepID=A0ACC2NRP1_9HYME|nr:hypothetical protein QAD02_005031 [Eretmocerus hayati]
MQSISGNQITTPYELYVWASQTMETMDVFFVAKSKYLKTKTSLSGRYLNAKTVPGTQSYHSVEVIQDTKHMQLARYSASLEVNLFPKPEVKRKRAENIRQEISIPVKENRSRLEKSKAR